MLCPFTLKTIIFCLNSRKILGKKPHSYQAALCHLTTRYHAIHSGTVVGTVFLDTSKDLDLVSHETLLSKLSCICALPDSYPGLALISAILRTPFALIQQFLSRAVTPGSI